MFMVMYVLGDPDMLDCVLDAWEQVGITGVTILESSGIREHRMRGQRARMRLPFGQIPLHPMTGSYTLMAIVADQDLANRCVSATEALVGDLRGPNTGVFAGWPLEMVRGLPKTWADDTP